MMMCSLYFSEQCIVKIFEAPSIFLPGMATLVHEHEQDLLFC